MAKYFLAADGGGTKTDVLCADELGNIVGQGSSGPTNLTSTSVGAASFNLAEAVRQSLESINDDQPEFTCFVMGLAGLDTEDETQVAREVFAHALVQHNIQKTILINDSYIALANGSDAPNAVVLISGTGAISFGRNQSGQTAKTGGMDYILTDQGSGYYIGRQVLREAVKSFDGRRPKTILEDLVCQHFKVASISEIKKQVYNPPLTKIEVAELAYLCSLAHQQQDQAAGMIFEHVVEELELHASTVIEKLNFGGQPFDLVLTGAVIKLEYIQKSLVDRLRQRYQNLNPIFPETPPVYGALKIAMMPRNHN
jgi:N-acetylglucosamine kinase-like BadF-type ATPase